MPRFVDKHFYLVELLVLGVVSVLCGTLVTRIVACRLISNETKRRPRWRRGIRKEPEKKPGGVLRASVSDVVKRNIFCAHCKPKRVGDDEQAGKAPKLSLDKVVLISTLIVPDDPLWTSAVIHLEELGTTRVVIRGNRIRDAVVTRIEPNRVEVRQGEERGFITHRVERRRKARRRKPRRKRRGRRQSAWSKTLDRSVRKLGPRRYQIRRQLVTHLMGNSKRARRDASIRPRYQKGRMRGVQFRRVRRDGLFARLGLRRGDVLTSINNQPLSSPDRILSLYTKLAGASHLTLGVERGRRTFNIDLSIR